MVAIDWPTLLAPKKPNICSLSTILWRSIQWSWKTNLSQKYKFYDAITCDNSNTSVKRCYFFSVALWAYFMRSLYLAFLVWKIFENEITRKYIISPAVRLYILWMFYVFTFCVKWSLMMATAVAKLLIYWISYKAHSKVVCKRADH